MKNTKSIIGLADRLFVVSRENGIRVPGFNAPGELLEFRHKEDLTQDDIDRLCGMAEWLLHQLDGINHLNKLELKRNLIELKTRKDHGG